MLLKNDTRLTIIENVLFLDTPWRSSLLHILGRRNHLLEETFSKQPILTLIAQMFVLCGQHQQYECEHIYD